ncbi:MAG: OsmC family protein [Flavobacteriales bacterium]
MPNQHHYTVSLEWTGNQGTGTDHYRSYKRDHIIRITNKPDVLGSADPTFRGNPERHNPEELLVAALSACHMMSFLHVCVLNGVIVTSYSDKAEGAMETHTDGSGKLTSVVLHPVVTVSEEGMMEKVEALHAQANKLCFIANSVNFPVRHKGACTLAAVGS